MIRLTELLSARGLTAYDKTRIVRHRDKRIDVHWLRRRGWFEFYQEVQSRPWFHGCKRVISFLGGEAGRSTFVGVYRVEGHRALKTAEIPKGFPPLNLEEVPHYRYALVKEPGFEDLEDRLVVKWGNSAISWAQWFRDREVIEILPSGFVMEWPGYEEVLLTHSDLRTIVEHPDANPKWHQRLSAVAGIYCIFDERQDEGQLYIGSAYGKDGIWGRWRDYAKTVHGGNANLKKWLSEDPDFKDGLRFSILHTMSASTRREAVVRWETLFKQKLGSRVFGLNENDVIWRDGAPPGFLPSWVATWPMVEEFGFQGPVSRDFDVEIVQDSMRGPLDRPGASREGGNVPVRLSVLRSPLATVKSEAAWPCA